MKKLSCFLVLVLTLIGFSLIAQSDLPKPGKYKIIPEESSIEAKTGTAGLLGFAGHPHSIKPSSFSGELELQPDGKTATVSLQIQAPSLKETADFGEKEKGEIETQLHNAVLETAKYPEISFQSTNVKFSEGAGHVFDAQIEGNMSLHGITQKITIPARVTFNDQTLRATGTFKINRPDYKIETKSAGGGTVKVAKTIDISFEFVLKQ
jgi:polyisoprenoid-binding protein YceI